MQRIPEPELMLDPAQAAAYASADFADAEALFVDLIRRGAGHLPSGQVVDLGCGPGGLSCRVAQAFPGWSLTAVDASDAMLALAPSHPRVRFVNAYVPRDCGSAHLPLASFDALVSSSFLHHLPDPAALWRTARALLKPGAPIVVLDLERPNSEPDARALVDAVAAGASPILQDDFYHSLLAAFSIREVRAQVAEAGLEATVERVSSRHLAVIGRTPAGA